MNQTGCIEMSSRIPARKVVTRVFAGLRESAFDTMVFPENDNHVSRLSEVLECPAEFGRRWIITLHDNGGAHDPAILAAKASSRKLSLEEFQAIFIHPFKGCVQPHTRFFFRRDNRVHFGSHLPGEIHESLRSFADPYSPERIVGLTRILQAALETWQPRIFI